MVKRTTDHAGDLAVQRRSRALGDPTRFAILRHIAEAHEPVTVAALTEHLGLNHTAIRQHLAKLVAAGLLVDEVSPPVGRGRPAARYRLTSVAAAMAGRSAYEQLSMMLLALARTRRGPRAVGADAGREAGLDLAPHLDEVSRLQLELTRSGFQPRRVDGESTVELVLEQCPFESAAMANPAIVCELHRGFAEGLAEAAGGRMRVIDLVAQPADAAGCRLRLDRDYRRGRARA